MYEAISKVIGIIASEKGLKIVKLLNCSVFIILDSFLIFCLGNGKKKAIIGAITKGNNIFRFGLNISLEAIFDI